MAGTDIKIVGFEDFAQEILALRFEVFVGEQNVDPRLEIDGLDPECIHAIAMAGPELIGCGRMQADGHIGRVAVKKSHRHQGVGRSIMLSLHEEAKKRGIEKLWLASQVQATAFYEDLGYETEGEVFVEAGIDHIKMFRLKK